MRNRIAAIALSLFIIIPSFIYAAGVGTDGSLNHSVNIQLPPGTNGVKPNLSLDYNSNAGNGIAGQGWSLNGLPVITRDSRFGIKYDATDTYCGRQGRLMYQGPGLYHYEYEDYSKVEIHGTDAGNPDYWVETRADGTKYYYGNYGDAPSANIKAIIFDKNGNAIEGKIRVWALSRVEDVYGNYYMVTYINEDGEFYPDKIVYTRDTHDNIDRYRAVEFEYDDRSDYSESYEQSAKVIRKKRLSSITVKVGIVTILGFDVPFTGDIVRSYELEYTGGTSGVDYSRILKINEYGKGSFLINEELYGWSGVQDNLDMNQPGEWVHNYGFNSAGLATRTDTSILPPKVVNGWAAPNHLRLTADVNGDGREDIVGFGNAGVYVSISTGTGFSEPETWIINKFDSNHDWSEAKFPRMMADVNGDGKADIIGFSSLGTWVSLSDGTKFTDSTQWHTYYGYDTGWRVGTHPRFVVDVDGDGKADLVGFASDGVRVALSTGTKFGVSTRWIAKFGSNDDWTDSKYPRMMADVNGDGKADVIGFASKGTWVSLSTGSSFTDQVCWNSYYGYDTGWRVELYPRTVADVNGDGKADIIGFASNGTYVALSSGKEFITAKRWSFNFDYDSGWRVDRHPRMMADVNGDGKADLVGFAEGGTCISLSNGIYEADGKGFTDLFVCSSAFGRSSGSGNWSVTNHERMTSDVDGDGKADIVGFYNNGVNVSTKVPQFNTITSIQTNSGMLVEISYNDAVKESGAIQPDNPDNLSYPNIANSSPRLLVKTIKINDGRGSSYLKEYSYTNGKIFMGFPEERKNLYFESITETDTATGITTTTEYNQDDEWLAGNPERVVTANGSRNIKVDLYSFEDRESSTGTHFTMLNSRSSITYVNGAEAYTLRQSYTYDDYGNVTQTSETDLSGGVQDVTTNTTYAIDIDNWILRRPSRVTKTSGGVTIQDTLYEYNGVKLASSSVWLSTTGGYLQTKYVMDDNGNITSITDPMNRTTALEYDDGYRSFAVKVTNPLGHTVTAEYDAATGNQTGKTDQNGNTTENVYDDAGRVKEVIDVYGDTVKTVYYHDGGASDRYIETALLNDSGDSTCRIYYDGLGREYRKETTGHSGDSVIAQVEVAEFDVAGRVARKSLPYIDGKQNPLYITYEYDEAGRVISETRPDGENSTVKVTTAYSAGTGSIIAVKTDQKGNTWTAVYDAAGRIIRKNEPEGGKVAYTYDAAGRLTRTSDSANNITTIAYDSLGRKTSITDPNAGTVQYEYDNCGNVTSKTDAGGITTSYTYDELSRVTYIDYSDATPDVTYTYDESSASNGKGRVTTVEDGISVSKYAYDSNGNIEYNRQSVDNRDFIFTMVYDSQNRMTSITYPDGTQINREYSGTGHLQAVTKSDGDVEKAYVKYGLAKNADGSYTNAVKRITGNGVETTITFNRANNRPDNVTSVSKDNEILENNTYAYDIMGNISSITDNIDSSKSQTFTYDGLNRLKTAHGVYGDEAYAYSAAGNMTQNRHGALQYNDPDHPYAVTADATGKTYSYDDNGNMILRGDETLRWDAAGRLTETEKNGTVTQKNKYDHTGHRVVKELNNGTTVYNIGGLYELTIAANRPDCHTKYIYGMEGDTVAQVTTTGVTLVSSAALYDLSHDSNKIISATCSFITAADRFVSNTRNIKQVYWVIILIAASAILLAWILTMAMRWRRNEEYSLWSSAMSVFISLSLLLTFTGCDIPGMPGLDDIVFGGAADTGGLPEQGTYYFHPDHLGSTSYLTDAAGHVVTRMSYRPYGEKYQPAITGLNILNKKYTGQVDDSTGNDNGLMYYNARYYDPALGRFISADTVIPDGGFSQAYNRYMYVIGNPVNINDPTGHWGVIGGIFKKIADIVIYHCVKTISNWIDKHIVKPVKDTVLSGSWWKGVGNWFKDKWQENQWLRITVYAIIIVVVIVVAILFAPAIYAAIGIEVSALGMLGYVAGAGIAGALYYGTDGKIYDFIKDLKKGKWKDWGDVKEVFKDWDWEQALKGFAIGSAVGLLIPLGSYIYKLEVPFGGGVTGSLKGFNGFVFKIAF